MRLSLLTAFNFLFLICVQAQAAVEFSWPEPGTVANYKCNGPEPDRIQLYLGLLQGEYWVVKHSEEAGITKFFKGRPIDLHLISYSHYIELYFYEFENPESVKRSKLPDSFELGSKHSYLQTYEMTGMESLSILSIGEKFSEEKFQGKTVKTLRLEREFKQRYRRSDRVFAEGTYFADYSPDLRVPIRYGYRPKGAGSKVDVAQICELQKLQSAEEYR